MNRVSALHMYVAKNLPWSVPATSLLYACQNARCFYCNKYMLYMAHMGGHIDDKGYTVDHLFPRSSGYRKAGNSVLACRRCNEIKGNKFPKIKHILKARALYKAMGKAFVLED